MSAPPDLALHWRIRRRTMFACIVLLCLSTIGFGYIGVFNSDALSAMGVLIGWFYGSISLPIIGYFSNTAVEEYVKNRKM
ncbi:hypothetical protein [Alishewanella phage vB_AspM_Slickus01]|nr:hypothetical protein [Alishewanella phage vB_AspM_Slicko01]WGH49873.1 hypothetical protein [Alishewanella phage vB_AspM_Slickus01]